MRIVICDDDRLFMELLEEQTKDIMERLCGSRIQVSGCCDGQELLEQNEADIYFLDIDMPVINGIEAANRLQEQYPGSILIFVTNREDLVFEAIKCQPFRFIRKAKIQEELEEAIQAALWKKEREERILTLETKDAMLHVYSRDIEYIESQGHYLRFHQGKNCYKVRGRLNEQEQILDLCGFVRIHASYLVNMRYVESVTAYKVYLDDKTELPVSRKKLTEVKKRHLQYIRRFMHGTYS